MILKKKGKNKSKKDNKIVKNKKNYVALDNSNIKPTLQSYITIFLGLGWLITFPLFAFCWIFLLDYLRPFLIFITSCIFISFIYPHDRKYQPEIAWEFGKWITSVSTCYFSFKVEFEDFDIVENSGPSIFVSEPHGVLPIPIFWGSLELLKKHKFLCCLSSMMFNIPMMKHVLTWASAISVDKKTIEKYLKQGYSLNICPGGVQEVKYLAIENEVVLFLKSRLGLTKIALQQGVNIVPSFTFGLNKCYDFHVPTNESLINIGRYLGYFPMIFYGLWGIPYAMPKPCPLTVVVGSPINIPLIENPTSEDIHKYHDIFLEEMATLYERNKDNNGYKDIILRIV